MIVLSIQLGNLHAGPHDLTPGWRVVGGEGHLGLAARSGPDEKYPVVAELTAGQVVYLTTTADDWAAVRLESGQTVWLPIPDLEIATTPSQSPNTLSQTREEPLPSANAQETSKRRGPQETQQREGKVDPAVFTFDATAASRSVSPEIIHDGWRSAKSTPNAPANQSTQIAASTAASERMPPRGDDRLAGSHVGQTLSGTTFAPMQESRASPSTVALQRVLDRTEEQFGQLLLQDPTTWDLRPIEDALSYLATQPLSPEQILRLKSLVERVALARQIAHNSQFSQFATFGALRTGPHLPLAALPPSRANPEPQRGISGLVIPPPPTRITSVPPLEATSRSSEVAFAGHIQPQIPPPSLSTMDGVSPAAFISAPRSEAVRQESTATPSTSRTDEVGATNLREQVLQELNSLRRQRFAAVGRLVKAQVRRPSDPQYMIVNERGEIEAYLKPSPGTLLRTYVGHQVGINGRKIRSADGRGPLLMVDSVQVLDPPSAQGQSEAVASFPR